MGIGNIIRSRRSIRKYNDQPIDKEIIVFINKYDTSQDFTANKSPIRLFIRKNSNNDISSDAQNQADKK